jgi:penicillin-binding protein 1B
MPEAKKKQRKSKPRTKFNKMILVKILILALIIPAIAITAFLIHYYYIFDGTIEMKLGKRNMMAETIIFSAPTVLSPGKPMNFSQLVSRLRKLGYNEKAGSFRNSYYVIIKPNRLLIYNDASAPYDANTKAEIICSGDGIDAIIDPVSHTAREEFSLNPEILSNAIGENREKRRYTNYNEIPAALINAVLAMEDRRFFNHSGIDPIGIVRALILDLRKGDTVQGASTLTQQFVKNYFLTPERTWRRKFTDVYMSILLEKRLSKSQIFELYCNEVYLGQIGSFSIIGFGEAADVFFGKNVKDLTLDEAATLAGMITAPNRFTPLRYKEKATVRRNLVLDCMAEYGMISQKERDQAKSKILSVNKTQILNYSDAPYFVDYVQDQLTEKYGDAALARTKFMIYTTLDPDLQQAAYESIQSGMAALDSSFGKRKEPILPGIAQASLIAIDPRNGHILAMIGGRNYGDSQFNRITQSKRQPGSIFKPFVYAAALETAYSSSTPLTVVSTVLDEPTKFTFEKQIYEPGNYKDEYLGHVSMRQAIEKSLNVATIKFAEMTGYEKITEVARRLGLNEKIKPYPAMAIGSFEITPLEMGRAYTAFANQGLLSDLTSILKIYDNNAIKIFMTQSQPKKVLTPEIAFLVTSLLQSVIDHGTGAGARARGFVLPAAGKTGTSHDGWFAGYTPDLLCIVWVGFDDNRELKLPGSQSALPIWTEFMKKAVSLKPLKGEIFTIPEGIQEVEIDPVTGMLATEGCQQRKKDYFIKGTEPTIECYGSAYEQAVGSGASRQPDNPF